MDVGRIHRVLRLITILQSGTPVSAAALTRELGVSRRTLFRDLNVLEAAGIPYYHENHTGYRLAPSFYLPPVNLTVTEAMGLMTLAKAVTQESDQPLARDALAGIRKLVSQLPASMREVCAEMVARTSHRRASRAHVRDDADHYASLQLAIDEKRAVVMRYHSLFEESVIDVKLRPYHLHFGIRAWYVIGRCDRHRDVRTYKLARIQNLRVTSERFRMSRPFSIDRYLGKSWQMIPEGKLYRVELEFSPKMAHNVCEVRWHDSQQSRLLPDGRAIVRFEIDGLNEIVWWLLGYGQHVRVIRPAALRDRLLEAYRAAAAQYDLAEPESPRVHPGRKKEPR